MIQKDIDDIINELRVLIFIEIEPQSNKYRQLYLNADQYKIVGNYFGERKLLDDGKYEEVITKESDEIYTLPDLQTIN